MSSLLYHKMLDHAGHNIEIVRYGDCNDPVNVAVECVDCNMVIVDENRDSEEEDA